MYDNSRVVSYTNLSARPYRAPCSRWSLDTPTTMESFPHETVSTLPSSFQYPHAQRHKQVLAPNYVNYYPPTSSPPSPCLSNYARPRSTILCDSTLKPQSTYHVNDLRQRYESKAVVGIVKPMVHQLSYTQLNTHDNEYKLVDKPMTDSHYHNSTRSLCPLPLPTPTLSSSTSSVIYRTRPIPSHNHANGQPPVAPRRYSSISTNKRTSSHRSSRTTSTSSSIVGLNELSPRISSQDNEEASNDVNPIIIDVKRLEMFYGSVGTLVKAARSVAHLYITTTRQLANFEDWSCQQLGVPIWIYNTGANLKRNRQVRLLLAQHESCFALWSSLISDRAELRLPKENHVTCWLPESNTLAVFKFERSDACRLFFRHYYEILEYERRMNLANPPPLPAENSTSKASNGTKDVPRRYSRLKSISNKQDKEQEQQQFELRRCRSLSKIRTVKKSDISGPINFEHVNHIGGNGNSTKQRSSSGLGTLRSLHASMSNLPSISTITDRIFNPNKKRSSMSFESRSTAV